MRIRMTTRSNSPHDQATSGGLFHSTTDPTTTTTPSVTATQESLDRAMAHDSSAVEASGDKARWSSIFRATKRWLPPHHSNNQEEHEEGTEEYEDEEGEEEDYEEGVEEEDYEEGEEEEDYEEGEEEEVYEEVGEDDEEDQEEHDEGDEEGEEGHQDDVEERHTEGFHDHVPPLGHPTTPHSLDSYRKSLTEKAVYLDSSITGECLCSHNYASVQNAIHVPLPPSAPFGVQDILLAIREAKIEIKDHTLLHSPHFMPVPGTHLLEIGLESHRDCVCLAVEGLKIPPKASSTSLSVVPAHQQGEDDDEFNGTDRPEAHRIQVLLPRTTRWRKLMRLKITGIRAFLRHLDETAALTTTATTTTTRTMEVAAAPGAEDAEARATATVAEVEFDSKGRLVGQLLVNALHHKLGGGRKIVSLWLLGVETQALPGFRRRFVHCDEADAGVQVYLWDGWMLTSLIPSFLRRRRQWRLLPALTRSTRLARRRADLLQVEWVACEEKICPADRRARWALFFWLMAITCTILFLIL
ncbi:hypothetical protein DFQ27_008634 [Actinomortierella ambigua]|uniref:Uncharacterized protein n=1 Tax=Actinomortierella ambigua TaxID=1343610 RepID=A0A9P6PR09_9FUNG|nr:hypothetical protein DFQ27_008634 [Actinomortierella ambigua]